MEVKVLIRVLVTLVVDLVALISVVMVTFRDTLASLIRVAGTPDVVIMKALISDVVMVVNNLAFREVLGTMEAMVGSFKGIIKVISMVLRTSFMVANREVAVLLHMVGAHHMGISNILEAAIFWEAQGVMGISVLLAMLRTT